MSFDDLMFSPIELEIIGDNADEYETAEEDIEYAPDNNEIDAVIDQRDIDKATAEMEADPQDPIHFIDAYASQLGDFLKNNPDLYENLENDEE